MSFFYCAGDENGDPVLTIDKQVTSAAAKIRKTATIKQFAMGTVQYGHGPTPCFVLDTAKPPKLERHLQTFFGKGVPELKKAAIYTRKEWDENSKPLTDDDLPDFESDEETKEKNTKKKEPESKLNETVESLHWRASQTLKHGQKFVKISNKYMVEPSTALSARMTKQLGVLDKWANRSLESAEAYVEAVEIGDADTMEVKTPIKNLGACRKILWAVHKSISHDHGSGYPSKTTKKAASSTRSTIKKAHMTLKKA
jgi:hypothetical protein